MSRLRQLIHEIHRRSLWQILGIYVVGSWVVLQAVDTLAGALNLPDWAPPFALFLLIIGFPIVLATAFVQEGSRPALSEASGEEAAVPVSQAARSHHRFFTWRNAIAGGVVAFALWGVVAAGWMLLGSGAESRDQSAAAERSIIDLRLIAVLPFSNRAADEGESAVFFAEGIHDDILAQLSQIDSLTVISRTSVMQYAGTTKPMRVIAQELGVGTVLEGAVQRAGDRVRVNVQLIDASTDRHLWAQTYDEELTAANIFAIQSDIARKIAAALQATLAPDVEARIESRPTESLEAYDLFTRGRYVSNRSGTREDQESAADLYRQAIAADPAYAPAHVGLAMTYLFLWFQGFLAAEEALPQARAAVERALELDETLAEAHAALGTVLTAELRFEEAEREFQRALELNPGSADVHLLYSGLLLDLARYEEAVRQARRAVELDPLSMGNRLLLAARLMFTRDYDASIDELLRILELEPENSFAYYFLAAAYTQNGQHEEGLAAIRRSIELNAENLFGPTLLAWVYARAGQRDEALKALEQVEEQGPMLKELAIVYGELGDLDRAFEFLDRAYTEDPGSLTYLRADPTADSLKDDPRFDELMRKLGLR
jgi:TolB-like protein/Tfp pilus assembly protein PilF